MKKKKNRRCWHSQGEQKTRDTVKVKENKGRDNISTLKRRTETT